MSSIVLSVIDDGGGGPLRLSLSAPGAREVRISDPELGELALLAGGGKSERSLTVRAVSATGEIEERTVTIAVEGAGQTPAVREEERVTVRPRPGATRAPTVALSPDDVRRLRAYPRPPKDNGIGLHFHLDLREPIVKETVEHLKEIRATWTLIYAQDELQTELAARACFEAGIMPVVRIGRKVDEATDPAPFVEGLRRAWRATGWGATHPSPVEPLYVQLYNEPEDQREWMSGQRPADSARRFGEAWAAQAPKIVAAGGLVGIQVLGRSGFDEAVDAVKRNGQEAIWDKAFFVHHNYGQNHPPAYPYDAIKQQVDPGMTILTDHVAALKFLAHASWMKERLGFVLPQVGGEGGWWPGNDEDKHYPKVEWPEHAAYHKEMYEWLRTGVLSNGEPLPDYLFSITSWIAGSWTFSAQNWWGNILSPTGKLDQTIEAMKAIPPFVRAFSWDEGAANGGLRPDESPVTQPVVEPDQEPVKPEPLPVPAGDLKWDVRLDDLGVRLVRGQQPAWRLTQAEYWDDAKSEGKHHIYLTALRRDGSPAPGARFVTDWEGRLPNQDPVRVTTDERGEANMPMFVNFDPVLKNGIMFTQADGAASDVVRGMGLPFNHHVCFILTFQEA